MAPESPIAWDDALVTPLSARRPVTSGSMNVPVLVSGIVRQTMVLIAQLATTGGARAPLAQVADRVFMDLVRELTRQGVSRKVSADMFGMGLRSYLRRVQRLGESSTERGRSLWEAMLDYLQQESVVTRAAAFARFHRDDEVLVRGVLHDLCESGLVFVSGSGPDSVYRAATAEELGALRLLKRGEGLDELVWAIVYREGPLSRDGLAELTGMTEEELGVVLSRLVSTGRVAENGSSFQARSFVVPLGAEVGFEAAVFDHFQALVKTICRRLQGEPLPIALPDSMSERDVLGGSTYTFDIWGGHPLAAEVLASLREMRDRLGGLRQRVETFNAEHGVPPSFVQVVAYAGQCVLAQDAEDGKEESAK